jgi:uncharacterized protein YegL
MKTMICLILDRSGSMNGRENDVIGGVNTFLDEQKKLPDPASIAMVRFDTEATERFRAMQPLTDCAPLTKDDYQPRGGTPLLDAIGKTLTDLDNDWKAEQPERAILVIVTDGEENASREYKKAKIKEMIESRQASGKWAIVYLGANVDAFAEAGSMGIVAQNSGGYTNTSRGTKTMYAAMSGSVSQMRTTGATVAHNLGRNIGEDEDEQPKGLPTPPVQKTPAQSWSAPQASGAWTPPA